MLLLIQDQGGTRCKRGASRQHFCRFRGNKRTDLIAAERRKHPPKIRITGTGGQIKYIIYRPVHFTQTAGFFRHRRFLSRSVLAFRPHSSIYADMIYNFK